MGWFTPGDGEPELLDEFFYWACSFPTPVYVILGVIGAIAGFLYGVAQTEHHPQYLFAGFGFFAGAFIIPFIALVIRFIAWCVLAGLVALAFYYAFFKP